MHNIQSAFAYVKYRFRIVAARRPWLLQAVYGRINKHKHLLIGADTQVVIEGYPRSANTFALRAFRSVNPEVHIAHHMHAQSQIMEAVERGLPAMVLIRQPDAAIKSMLVRHPHIGVRAAILSYVQFYEDIEALSGDFLLTNFTEVTEDFGAVIQQLNSRFNTDFALFEHVAENVEQIYWDMDTDNKTFYGEFKATHVPRPHAGRNKIKAGINLNSEPALLRRAHAVYGRLTQQPDVVDPIAMQG